MESPQSLSREPDSHREALIPGRGGTEMSLIVSVDQEDTKEQLPQGLATVALQHSSMQNRHVRSHKHQPLSFEFSRGHFENIKDQSMLTFRKLRQEDGKFQASSQYIVSSRVWVIHTVFQKKLKRGLERWLGDEKSVLFISGSRVNSQRPLKLQSQGI